MNSWIEEKKIFNKFNLMLFVLLMLQTGSRAYAIAFEDQENENADGVIRWGQVNKKTDPFAHVTPISNDSFKSDTASNTRAPASVVDGVITKPVESSTSQTLQKPAEQKTTAHPPAKALARAIAKQKAFQEVAVIVNDLGFFPATLFVTQGIPVRLFVTGASKKSQCFMMDEYGIRRQIQNQKVEEITFTPEASGSFAFSCPMNGAKGKMLVKELELDRMPASVQNTAADSNQDDAIKDAEARSSFSNE